MCWSSYREVRHWDTRPRPVRRPEPRDDLRIGDADRERAISSLSRHTGDGRLTLEEFEERVDEALRARTNAELRGVFRGLPEPDRRPVRRVPRVDPAAVVRPVLTIALVIAAVAFMGAWILWFAIPFAWCRLGGRAYRYRGYRDGRDELIDRDEPATQRSDDLTLV